MEVFCKGLLIADESGCLCFGEQDTVRDQTPIQYATRHWVTHWRSLGRVECEVPRTVTSIGEGAFENCRALASINIPEGIEEIDDSAFDHCDALDDATRERIKAVQEDDGSESDAGEG